MTKPIILVKICYTVGSWFYLQGPDFCEIREVLMSLQILILNQLFSFTVNVLRIVV